MGRLTIDGRHFKLDGEIFQIRSGAIHYFRVLPEYWEDRLIKLINCGFNTVETYVPWNLHEPEEGEYCFEGIADVVKFLETAQRVGLKVILRVTPYICSEWDLGGLPYWLLKYKDLKLRCKNKIFFEKIDRYYGVILPKIRPLLSQNGGPIIAMSVENEYGSYGNDKEYLEFLRGLYEKYAVDTFLFNCDGANETMISCGMQENVFEAVNFNCDTREKSFKSIEKFQPGMPRMCMECYPVGAYHNKWGKKLAVCDVEKTVAGLRDFFESGDSFNIYMFHGGTNFAFYNGATYFERYAPVATQYWNAQAFLDEAGNCTELYYRLKEAVRDIAPVDVYPESKSFAKAYGSVKLTESAELFENLDNLSRPQYSSTALSFEELGADYGYVLYRTRLPKPSRNMPITLKELHGRYSFYIDGEFIGIKDRAGYRNDEIKTSSEADGVLLEVLCENLGRINYGPYLRDKQGITDGVILGGQRTLFGYEMLPITLKDISGVKFEKGFKKSARPMLYRGCLEVDTPADTFLDMSGFSKGVVFVNGFNLGKYWSVGPQCDLYLPAPLLKSGKNEIVVFESDGACKAEIISKSDRTLKGCEENNYAFV